MLKYGTLWSRVQREVEVKRTISKKKHKRHSISLKRGREVKQTAAGVVSRLTITRKNEKEGNMFKELLIRVKD